MKTNKFWKCASPCRSTILCITPSIAMSRRKLKGSRVKLNSAEVSSTPMSARQLRCSLFIVFRLDTLAWYIGAGLYSAYENSFALYKFIMPVMLCISCTCKIALTRHRMFLIRSMIASFVESWQSKLRLKILKLWTFCTVVWNDLRRFLLVTN